MMLVSPMNWTDAVFEALESKLPALEAAIATMPDEMRQKVARLLDTIYTLHNATESTSLIASERKLLSKRASTESSSKTTLDGTVSRKGETTDCSLECNNGKCKAKGNSP